MTSLRSGLRFARRWITRRARYADALRTIGTDCESFYGGRSTCVNSGRIRGAYYGVEKWCDGCIAREALS